jgi:saccharopine dehydrogenase (NAD+, L-lysine-forming)
MTTTPHLWLRAETKKNEHRTALTPSVCKTLLAQGTSIIIQHQRAHTGAP